MIIAIKGDEKGDANISSKKLQKVKSTDSKNDLPPLVWNKKVPNTHLEQLKKIVEEKYDEHFESYWDLHKWSTDNLGDFWEVAWHYFGIKYSKPYDKVYEKTGPGILDCEWFPGVRFNFAENILRIRDSSVAIIYLDEYGHEERVTFAEMFEEVKLYAAAFKKNGLQKGDRVACYMSNRKEAIFTFLAAASIGAVFGGPQPFFTSRPASNIVQKMEAKFLIAIDHHLESGEEYHNIDYLPDIVNNAPSLEKVIIIPSKADTFCRDLSNIRNSCLLEDFLDSGRTPDGSVPELHFEQLPFDHPLCINFTSGTTGLPKGPVHSAGSIISHMTNIVFYWNLNKGDVVHTCYPVGWTLWDAFVPCLAWGVTVLLYAGNMLLERQGDNLWDIFSRYKVTYCFLPTSIVDKLEKYNILPRPNTNLDSLKFLTMGGSPVKAQNYLFIRNHIKEDVFVCSQYGSTETFGAFCGFDLNQPVYAGEIQAPSLGMDIRCFDEEGKSVVNKRGEMVLAAPTPALPIYIWRDEDNSVLKETYLSKYPGVWCQNDEIWINPQTKGFVVIGRSDDTLIQNGDRYGAGDVYIAIHDMEEIQDCICVAQRRESDGENRAVLFIKMKNGHAFTGDFKARVEQRIAHAMWYECVPELILEIEDIPYNLNNKKMESIVRKIISTNKVPEANNIRNPQCLKHYCDIPQIVNY
ncbi:hypothetical protein JTE90_015109 [Oedothorax gibbosus]|uniref:Acetoacetyl-CoA synthetase n=1 Tax=Oedothorax gibbosus TaxID=931172 RepID=A0AAV6VQ14_9ARAC|nr:hypothetical protein JTE90_015109 [Oedothorax gibbosus]